MHLRKVVPFSAPRPRHRRMALAAILLLLLVACGGEGGTDSAAESPDPAAPAATDDAQPAATEPEPAELKEVSFRFDVTASGYVAPFLLAEEKGYYEEEGLTVNFGEGSGSSTTISVVAEGQDDFGWADFGTMTKLQAEGADVKAVAIVGQQSPLAVITNTESGITEPSDLEGKTIGQNPGGATAAIWEAFVAASGIDQSKIRLVAAKENSHAQLLKRGRTAGFTGWITFESPAVEELEMEPVELLWSDYGVNVMNVSIVTRNELLENDPETVCGFVRGSLRAYEEAKANPDEAIQVLLDKYQNVNEEIARKQLEKQLTLTHTENTEGEPLGFVAEEDVVKTQDILAEFAGLTDKVDPSELFTNECIEG